MTSNSNELPIDQTEGAKALPGHFEIQRRASLGWIITRRIAVVFIVFGALSFFVARKVATWKFQGLEKRDLLDRTRQIFLNFNHEAADLKSITSRIAGWGDTYENIHHPTLEYLARNYGGSWPKANNIDFVLMVAPDGRRTWSSDGYPSFGARGPETFATDHFSLSDRAIFRPADGGRPIGWFIGLIGSREKTWIYCAHAITGYNSTQPSRGMLIFGREISMEDLSSYTYGHGDTLSLVALSEVPELNKADDYTIVGVMSAFGGTRTVVSRERNAFVSYTPLKDVRERPLVALRLSIPRTGENVAMQVVQIMETVRLFTFVISLGLVLVLVRITVILPIKQLASFFTAHGEDREGILKASAQRSDEIGILAQRAEALITKVLEQTAELERHANTDRLTGLANRRLFETHIQSELRRLLRYRHVPGRSGSLAVVMVDVDHFKLFNDTNGHMAGDVCLRAIAEAIKSCIFRPGDLACRFGGEEFLLVLPDTDEAGALVVAEAVRASVEGTALPHPASSVSAVVTVSVGAAAAEVTEALRFEKLIEMADKALYVAKHEGRNRVVGSSSSHS